MILISFAREKKKNMFIGFIDYAKAFDFANRADKIFTDAVAKTFKVLIYHPKIGETKK